MVLSHTEKGKIQIDGFITLFAVLVLVAGAGVV